MRRDLAATALGWYLLMPPMGNLNEPDLRQWDHSASYDTAAACQAGKDEQFKRFMAVTQSLTNAEVAARREKMMRSMLEARCIQSTDPRLADRPKP